MYSKHARKRKQQRSLSAKAIELVLQFGKCTFDSKGGERYDMDKRARSALKDYLGYEKYQALKGRLNIYVVTSGGVIITVGHRTKRFSFG